MSTGSYADFFKALGQIESGQTYNFVSPPGYLGYYQFAEETLQAAGFYVGDGADQVRDFAGAWTAKAATYGVTDKASFLASPAAQDAAATAWFERVFADLNALDLVKYEGQTLNGLTLTPSSLLAGTHLVGVWALKDYLTSGGDHVPRDGNNFAVTRYMDLLGGYETPFAFNHSGPVTLSGGSGADGLHGFDGDDSLSGGGGENTLRGGAGADTLQGGAGFDAINGNTGQDLIDGGAGGDDWLLGGQGDDRIIAHAGNVIINGNLGADTVTGGWGDDIVRGGQGDDRLDGGAGRDRLFGDLGDDVLTGGAGADIFYFSAGGGRDRVTDFNPGEGDRLSLGGGYTVGQVGADTVVTLASGDQLTLLGLARGSLADGWVI